MENLADFALRLLVADPGVLAMIVALAAITVSGVGFWAAVQITKRGGSSE